MSVEEGGGGPGSIELRVAQMIGCSAIALVLSLTALILRRKYGLASNISGLWVSLFFPSLILMSFSVWSWRKDRNLRRFLAFTLLSFVLAILISDRAKLMAFTLSGMYL